MTLNQKYRIHRKCNIKRYIKLFCVIAFICLFGFSYSSYTSLSNINITHDIAKWEIKINDVEINNNITSIENKIKLIPTSPAVNDGIIKAGQKGYFDIKVDPNNTEVSLDYSIDIDFTKMPEEIKMTSYSIIQNEVETNKGNLPANNKFEGEIKLSNREKLTQANSIIYRIYWQWNGEDYDIDYGTYEISADITVQQVIV